MRQRSSRRRKVVAGVAVLLTASSFTAIGTPIAGASPARPTVAYGKADHFCLYQHKEFSGTERCYNDAQIAGGLNLDSVMDDQASSLVNNLPYSVCFWTGANFGGDRGDLSRASYWRNLTKNSAPGGATWNDRITSVKKC